MAFSLSSVYRPHAVLCALICTTFMHLNLLSQDFLAGQLQGVSLVNPTSLQFGPDNRLYISEQYGQIDIYEIERTQSSGVTYSVVSTESINLVRQMQNHNDDGTVYTPTLAQRQITGLCVTGTAQNPVIYVSSSDPRQGGGEGSNFEGDVNIDTNSGTISRLTWDGNTWQKIDLIRGLPRSEENHATNGLFLDETTNTLYVAQGGNTNAGGPSRNFAFLCEFTYSTAILAIDLGMLDTMQVKTDTSSGASYLYDLPTLDDPERDNANGINDPTAPGYDGVDLHDPFGGNDGLNQAKFDPNGPISIYSPGFRNIYDVVITESGKMYTWDNGPNFGWGGYPEYESTDSVNNNWISGEPGAVNNKDGLHFISSPGYYGGHPNPTRANPAGAGLFTNPLPQSTNGNDGFFRTEYLANNPDSSLPYDWPPYPVDSANLAEGDYISPGMDASLYIHEQSTNGIVEYTASNFNDTLSGNLLAVGYGFKLDNTSIIGPIYRVKLNANGTIDSPSDVTILASGLGFGFLDITALGDGTLFPGTIWVVDHLVSSVWWLEPNDFAPCAGLYDNTIDEDGDGYTNADEMDNGTSPCNNSDRPSDFDKTLINGFLVSNLNDPDDDDDGINDTLDVFFWDGANGDTTTIPLAYPMLNENPGFGFSGLGFTGWMMNLEDDYIDLLNSAQPIDIISGGAAGVLTIVNVDDGDALDGINNQKNAFQFGVRVDSTDLPFIYKAQLVGPVFSDTIQDNMSTGIFIGTGDQDNYIRLAVNANGGSPGILVTKEVQGISESVQYAAPEIVQTIGSASTVWLYLYVDPARGVIQPQYSVDMEGVVNIGQAFKAFGPFLDSLKGSSAIAVGLSATSRNATAQFNASWSQLSIEEGPPNTGEWITLNDATSCQPAGTPGSCPLGKHEASYVQVGDKFYWLGGREDNSNVNIYDVATDTWTVGADAPMNSLHHFQAINYHGLILVAGAFTGTFPNETPVDRIYLYDPLSDTWHDGPEIPPNRRRGAAGLVEHDGKLYLVSGIQNGHVSGWVPWLDAYDPVTNTWTVLPDAPRSRDHFHAAVVHDTLYAAAGRRSGQTTTFTPTEPIVDYYDLNSPAWGSLQNPIPTERAGNTVAVLGDELIVIGGETGDDLFAKAETEALDVKNGTWRTLAPLNEGRHGTQAIVNNGGIYVASGSFARGSSPLLESTEAFYLYGQTQPVLNPISGSTLAATLTGLDVPVLTTDTAFGAITLQLTGGDQASVISSITPASGDTSFRFSTTGGLPRILVPGNTLQIDIEYRNVLPGLYHDTILIAHTGASGPELAIPVSIEVNFIWTGTNRIYVDSSASGSGMGDSWTDAFKSLGFGIQIAADNPQIDTAWVAGGTYFVGHGNDRNQSLVIPDGLHILGGFAGTESQPGERNPELNPVRISGDIGIPGDSSDNTYHVLRIPDSVSTATIEDVTIQYGNADGTAPDDGGAGIFAEGHVTLKNVTVRFCQSVGAGAAITLSGSNALVELINTQILDNVSPTGIMIYNGTGTELRVREVNEIRD